MARKYPDSVDKACMASLKVSSEAIKGVLEMIVGQYADPSEEELTEGLMKAIVLCSDVSKSAQEALASFWKEDANADIQQL